MRLYCITHFYVFVRRAFTHYPSQDFCQNWVPFIVKGSLISFLQFKKELTDTLTIAVGPDQTHPLQRSPHFLWSWPAKDFGFEWVTCTTQGHVHSWPSFTVTARRSPYRAFEDRAPAPFFGSNRLWFLLRETHGLPSVLFPFCRNCRILDFAVMWPWSIFLYKSATFISNTDLYHCH